jgi:hypothetical protein
MDGDPQIRLAIEGGDENKRYRLGKLRIAGPPAPLGHALAVNPMDY